MKRFRIPFGHLPLTVLASVRSDAHGDEGLESVPELDITDIPLVEPFAVLVRNVSSSAEPATLAQAFRGLEVGHDCCPGGNVKVFMYQMECREDHCKGVR